MAALIIAALWSSGAMAQPRDLPGGAGVVTTFSGMKLDRASGDYVLDRDGKVVRVLDLSRPGYMANGSRWDNAPELQRVLARDVGQLFGIAVDNARPANIYVTGSSAFGLFRTPDNSGWMDGMWGLGGGPGTVYRLRASNGYRPEIFANLTLEGRPNSGAGLGNIAFDETNNQLFVSDLETGMIFRLDTRTGQVVDHYDHGIDARAYYLDAATAEYEFSNVVSFDPASAPDIADCGDGPADQAAARFAADPTCWNIADFRRRVYGLGVHKDAETDAVRLYYAVWGGQGFGNAEWDEAGDDAKNMIWSVGLDAAGGFDLQTVRREFEVPRFFASREDIGAYGPSHPVTDIAFSRAGAMFLAERGGIAGVSLFEEPLPVAPMGSRVLVFSRGQDGLWAPDGRFDIGYDERSKLDPPHLRTVAAGGLALGFGYTPSGRLDPNAPEAKIWMTGDDLCAEVAPCPTPDGQGADSRPTTGIQGTPATRIGELAPPQAYTPYPNPAPVIPPTGPNASNMIGLEHGGGPLTPGHVGDIEIYRGAAAPPAVAEVPPDLAASKRLLSDCGPEELCAFEIVILNAGANAFAGPIVLSEDIGGGLVYRAGDHGEWVCAARGGHVTCYDPGARLAPGARLSLTLSFLAPRGISESRVRNCVAIEWLGAGGREALRAVQFELARRGFDPGLADGVMGPRTRQAIRRAERSFGLDETGEFSDDLLIALFGPGGARARDANPRNNRDCIFVDIDIPPPPAHQAQISAFHRRFESRQHDPRTSGPIEVHDPAISAFHLRYRSSQHDGTTTRNIPVHRTAISLFHRTQRSDLHDPATTRERPRHERAISNFHRTARSSEHDPATTRERPRHERALSNFHRTARSSEHDPATTRERPRHERAVSNFHRTARSSEHDPATTRERPTHNPALSVFHRTLGSSLHNRATSDRLEIHLEAVSAFHRSNHSSRHDTGTSRERHDTAVSSFHRSNRSSQHDPATSGERHDSAVSRFHGTNRSSAHDPRTSHPQVTHLPALSEFHRTNHSSQHDPETTRARATIIHPPAIRIPLPGPFTPGH